jgi:hypothetical protein
MGKRYAVAGVNTTSLDGTCATATGIADATALFPGRYLIGRNMSANRDAFYLKSAWFYNASGAVPIILFDATMGSVATESTRRFKAIAASGQTTLVEFPSPGLKFTVACLTAKDSSGASGQFLQGRVGGMGYEE